MQANGSHYNDKHMHACMHVATTLNICYIYTYIIYMCTEVPGSSWMVCICLVKAIL